MLFSIADVINTLNNIEVKGKANMDRLLGAIMALEVIQESLQKTSEEQEKTEDKGE